MTAKKRPRRNYSAQADKLFSQIIRARGVCESGRYDKCCGPLQCAHGFSRRYRAVRWHPFNAFSLCAGCHMYYTHHPLEWDEWLIRKWGTERYNDLRRLALGGVQPDFPSLVAQLKEQARAAA